MIAAAGDGTTIVLDAREWRTRAAFFAALLPALRTPDWAGGNLDALFDCLVARHIGAPFPISVRLRQTADLPTELMAYLVRATRVFDDARREYRIDAWMTIEP